MDPIAQIVQARSSKKSAFHYDMEADMIWREIEKLIETDPVGASRSNWIRELHLKKWSWLLSRPSAEYAFQTSFPAWEQHNPYPHCEDVGDVLLQAPYIASQLVAEEYFEGREECSPLTPEAFENFDFSQGSTFQSKFQDPFATEERPNVTIEMEGQGRINLNPACPVDQDPLPAMREVGDPGQGDLNV